MSFQAASQLQELPLSRLLDNLQQGQTMTIVVTNAPAGVASLEFKHANDPEWRVHPGFDGTASADDVIVQSLVCLSATMRLVFVGVPVEDYYVSIVWNTSADH